MWGPVFIAWSITSVGQGGPPIRWYSCRRVLLQFSKHFGTLLARSSGHINDFASNSPFALLDGFDHSTASHWPKTLAAIGVILLLDCFASSQGRDPFSPGLLCAVHFDAAPGFIQGRTVRFSIWRIGLWRMSHVEHVALVQHNLKRGLEMFGQAAIDAVKAAASRPQNHSPPVLH